MELTPKVFRDVQFREKLRGGYHPEDVDEFLEQAAQGVEDLTERLRLAMERAQRAEQASAEASATDDALKKMLLMAQRTADQAIKEAREEAERSVREAREQAERMMAEARAKSSSAVAEAEEKGRRAYEGALADSRTKMDNADAALRQALEEVEALRGWVDVHKAHLLGVLRDAQDLVEKAGFLSDPPAVSAPEEVAAAPSAPAPAAPPPAAPDDGSEPATADDATGEHFVGTAPVDEPEVNLTGEWDPRYLDDLSGVPAGTTAPVGPAEGDDTLALTGDKVEGATPEPATIAIDERALDSFFSDRDLSEERGVGRFRRRS